MSDSERSRPVIDTSNEKQIRVALDLKKAEEAETDAFRAVVRLAEVIEGEAFLKTFDIREGATHSVLVRRYKDLAERSYMVEEAAREAGRALALWKQHY